MTHGAERTPTAASLRDAVLWTVLYSGTFQFPLRRDEVFHFLIAPEAGASLSQRDVEAATDALIAAGVLDGDGVFVYPPGRAEWVVTRRRRRRCALAAWTSARTYARLIWMVPYVRMVAVTGALAMDNVEEGDDIDLFIVVEPGRLWLTRGMILVLVKLARARRVVLCPNFILSTRALRLDQRDLYTAHELAQMVPLHGAAVADAFLAENAWSREFLPNARKRNGTASDRLPPMLRAVKSLGQAALDLPIGASIERWEQRRKISKLSQAIPVDVREARYTADMCKGHADGHGRRILDHWINEIERLSTGSGTRSRTLTG